jgi:hypothetical protein
MFPKGMGNIGNMVKQAMELKNNMEELKESLAGETVEASSGGGMVNVVMNGKMEVLSLKIDPVVAEGGDREMMETLVMAAMNEGVRKAQDLVKEKMSEMTGGIDIPGLM